VDYASERSHFLQLRATTLTANNIGIVTTAEARTTPAATLAALAVPLRKSESSQ